jgi:hypothetical protein
LWAPILKFRIHILLNNLKLLTSEKKFHTPVMTALCRRKGLAKSSIYQLRTQIPHLQIREDDRHLEPHGAYKSRS